MTIKTKLEAECTDCGKQLHLVSQYHFDDMEELMEAARSKGWEMQVLVPNGSKWDFCSQCHKQYLIQR
jgi:hypothetical protein